MPIETFVRGADADGLAWLEIKPVHAWPYSYVFTSSNKKQKKTEF